MRTARQPWPLWTRILGIGGAILAAVVIVAAVWYGSTADLERIRSRAEAQGVALTWADFSLATITPDERRAWDDLNAATRSVTTWRRTEKADGGYHQLPQPGEVIPDGLREHVAAQAAARAPIAALPRRSVGFYTEITFDTRLDWITSLRTAVDLQSEYACVVDTDALPAALDDLLALGEYPPDAPTLITLLVHVSLLDRILSILAYRHDDLDPTLRQDLSERLGRMADHLPVLYERALRGECLAAWILVQSPSAHAAVSMTSGIPSLLSGPLLRVGREPLFTMYLDALAQWQASPDPATFHAFLQAREADLTSIHPKHPSYLLARVLLPAQVMVHSKYAKAHSLLHLAARLLRQEAPGSDPISGQAYIEKRRDGAAVGWYSPGFDGDQSGDARKDWCLAWDAPWKDPVPGSGTMPEPGITPTVESAAP